MTTILKKWRIKRRILSKNGKKLSFLFIFVGILMFFLLIVNISDIFSSLITSEKSLFLIDKIEKSSYNVYCVSFDDFENEEEAENCCDEIRLLGGMGVVFRRGEYFALTSIYPTLIEAQEIQQNLLEMEYNAKVVKLEVKAISKEYKGSNKELIGRGLQSFREIFIALYETCIKFDKNLINESQVKGNLAEIWTKNKNLQKSFENAQMSLTDEEKNLILDLMSDTNDTVEQTLLFSGEKLQLSSLLKQSCFDIVQLNIYLFENFV
ncbi:MAG: hypothetical protein EOM55_01690 [Clostridia bacterium]|nr:hypothetical protein [Clostridia bacterium]